MRLDLRRSLPGLAILGLIAAWTTGYSTEYSGRPITARVIDEQTRQPIEGVIVLAHWQLDVIGRAGQFPSVNGRDVRLLELTVLETVTDRAGTFHFPAWGPKTIPAGVSPDSQLNAFDPQLLFFKSGYLWKAVQNLKAPDDPLYFQGKGPSLRSSDYDGKTIELKKFAGSKPEYDQDLSLIYFWLDPMKENCAWRDASHFMTAINAENQGNWPFGPFAGAEAERIRKVCASSKQ